MMVLNENQNRDCHSKWKFIIGYDLNNSLDRMAHRKVDQLDCLKGWLLKSTL